MYIYILHASSHLLKQQGKIDKSLNDSNGGKGLRFSEDELTAANRTLKNSDVPSFEIIDKLVQEEVMIIIIIICMHVLLKIV